MHKIIVKKRTTVYTVVLFFYLKGGGKMEILVSCIRWAIILILILEIILLEKERKKLKKTNEQVREIGDMFDETIKGAENRLNLAQDAFLDIEENVLNEISEAIKNLEAGRYEETHNILECLASVVSTDVVFEKERRNKKN